jgi:hypothetical protein
MGRIRPINLIWVAVVLGVFWAKGILALDADFGWHLRAGNLFLSQGIPETDQFSYTMPSYPWVDHEWLTDALAAGVYPRIGMIGLAGIYAGVVTAALWIAVRTGWGNGGNRGYRENKLELFRKGLFLLAAGSLVQFGGVRPQVVSWLMLAVLTRVIFDPELWRKWRMWLPLFFAVWANLHGGFAMGLGLVGVVGTIRIIRGIREIGTIRVDWGDAGVLVLSAAATLVNPYGLGLWREVWSSTTDVNLRSTIVEWKPIYGTFNFPLLGFIGLTVSLVWNIRKELGWEKIGLFMVFLVAGLTSMRNIPLYIVVALPIAIETMGIFYQKIRRSKVALERFAKMTGWMVIFFVGMFLGWSAIILMASWQGRETAYPRGAVDYLRDHKFSGQIFSIYDWGGYLDWKIPREKVFIDGRMPSWRWQAPGGESSSAFGEYTGILMGKIDPAGVLAKYGVGTVLWREEAPLRSDFVRATSYAGQGGEILKRIVNFLNDPLGRRPKFSMIEWLEENGWKKMYGDGVAVVYRKQGF